jgi:hypothetical protein
MRFSLPAELLFVMGGVLFAGAFTLYGLILRRLLRLVGRSRIWFFLMVGAGLLICASLFHFYRVVVYLSTRLSHIPYVSTEFFIAPLRLGMIESWVMLAAGGVSVITGFMYYYWVTR